jgi:hypothetical protein
MEGSSGSVVLQQSHTSVNMEMAERQQQTATQRLEMAENSVKRTRHPFSGYKEILFRDRTTPVHKLTYKGKPKPYKMAQNEDERDQVFGGAVDEVRNLNVRAPEPVQPRDQNEPEAPRAVDDREMNDAIQENEFNNRFPGFQAPQKDPNTGDNVYKTLTAEGEEMFERWLQFLADIPGAVQFVGNHPDRVNIFYKSLLREEQVKGPEYILWFLNMLRGRENPGPQAIGPDDIDPNGNIR